MCQLWFSTWQECLFIGERRRQRGGYLTVAEGKPTKDPVIDADARLSAFMSQKLLYKYYILPSFPGISMDIWTGAEMRIRS